MMLDVNICLSEVLYCKYLNPTFKILCILDKGNHAKFFKLAEIQEEF